MFKQSEEVTTELSVPLQSWSHEGAACGPAADAAGAGADRGESAASLLAPSISRAAVQETCKMALVLQMEGRQMQEVQI